MAAVIATSFGAVGGCRQAQQAGRSARGIIGTVEPTGVVAETEARTQTWEAVKKRLDELDIQSFNDAVSALVVVADLVRARLEVLPKDEVASLATETIASLSALRKQAEAADIGETSRSLQELIRDLRTKASEIPTAEARTLVEEITLLTTELRATVNQLDDRLRKTVERSEEVVLRTAELADAVSPDKIQQVVDQINEATADAKAAIKPIGQAGARWPETTQRLDSALQAAAWTAKVAIVVLALWGLCAIAWFFRLARPRAARS